MSTTTKTAGNMPAEAVKATTTTEQAAQIKMLGYIVELSTAATVAAAMDRLPVYQTVRGCKQWSAEKAEALAADLAAGYYVPPIVYARTTDSDGETRLSIVDGQQRGAAIRAAVESGKLAPDTPVLVAVDTMRDGVDVFRVLNIGVPVGSALVTAVSLEGLAGQALLSVAEHEALSLVPWSAIQTGRTERAAFAASLLAICAGWSDPESSTKACEAWLKERGAEITDADRVKALSVADSIAAALRDAAAHRDGANRIHAAVGKRLLAACRKKNNWITLVQCVNDGYDAGETLALLADSVAWTKGAKYRPMDKAGKARLTGSWALLPVGSGSSGSYQETAARFSAAKWYLAEGGEYDRDAYAAADAKEAARVAEKQGGAGKAAAVKAGTAAAAAVDGGALAAALGGEV